MSDEDRGDADRGDADRGDATREAIRAAVRSLCAEFPPQYWRELDQRHAYPEAFVQALTKAGFLAALIPRPPRRCASR